jgi:hypothetical protein
MNTLQARSLVVVLNLFDAINNKENIAKIGAFESLFFVLKLKKEWYN